MYPAHLLLYIVVALVLSALKLEMSLFSGHSDPKAESAVKTSIYAQKHQGENDAESTEVAQLLPTTDQGK